MNELTHPTALTMFGDSAKARLDLWHAYVDVNGIRMHYVEQGKGPLVVLLHGFPQMWWSWRYQIPRLARAGFRVVAPDLRGYNETEARGPYDLDTLAEDIVALVNALGEEPAHLVGHDWGAVVAWRVATVAPQRCSSLVVINGPHPVVFASAIVRRWRQALRSWYVFFFQVPCLPERVLTRNKGKAVVRILQCLAVRREHFGDIELEPFARAACQPGRAHAMIEWYRGWHRGWYREASRRWQARACESSPAAPVRCRTLVLWGLGDRALGFRDVIPGTERYATSLEIQTLEGCGHFPHEEMPDETAARMIEFLRGSRL